MAKDRAKSEIKIIEDGDESFTGDVVGAFIGGFIGGIIAGPLGAFLGYTIANGISEAMPEVVSEVTSRIFPKLSLPRIELKKEKLSEIQIMWGRLIEKLFSDTIKELRKMYEEEYGVSSEWFDGLLEDGVLNVKGMESESLYEILDELMLKRGEIDIFRFLPEPRNENLRRFVRKNFSTVLKKNFERVIRAKAVEIDGRRIPLRLFFFEFVKVSLEYIEKELERLKKDVAELKDKVENLDNNYQDYQHEILGMEKKQKNRRNKLLENPFYGRDKIIQEIMKFVETNSGKLIITGIAGVGKSTLMANLAKRLRDSGKYYVIEWYFDSTADLTDPKDALIYIYLRLVLIKRKTKKLPFLDKQRITIGDLENRIIGILSSLHLRRKIVILIDALDEADELFYPFEKELPKNLVVIASTRESPDNLSLPQKPFTKWRYLEFWRENSKIIELNYLPYEAVRGLVFRRIKGIGNEKILETISKRIFEITEGYPVYLSYLLESLENLSPEKIEAELKNLQRVKGFEEYLGRELNKAIDSWPEKAGLIENILALLAVAKEPLSVKQMALILNVNRRDISSIPNYAKRWLSIRKTEHEEKWSYQHLKIREVVSDKLNVTCKQVQERIISFCAESIRNKDICDYCLKHYPEHLYEADRYDELLEIARNEGFINLQKNSREGVSLVFKTFELAIDAGIAKKDLAKVFEVAFVYNRVYHELKDISLLEHYRRYGLNATIELIRKESDPTLRTKSLLFFTSYLLFAGEDEEKVKKILIANKAIVLPDKLEALQALLKFWNSLLRKDKSKYLVLLSLSNTSTSKLIVDILRKTKNYEAGLHFIREIKDLQLRDEVSTEIAIIFAKRGELEKAKEIAKQIKDQQLRDKILKEIAIILTKFGNTVRALEIVKQIKAPDKVLKEISVVLVRNGNLKKALEIIEQIESLWIHYETLKEIALNYARQGDLKKALEIANQIEDLQLHDRTLKEIAIIFAKRGELEKAKEIAKQIWTLKLRDRTLKEIAIINKTSTRSESKKSINVSRVMRQIRDFGIHDKTTLKILEEIALNYARQGDLKKALEIANQIENPLVKYDFLEKIVVVLTKSERLKEALITLDKALDLLLQVEKLEDDLEREEALREFSIILAKSGELENALKVVNYFSSISLRMYYDVLKDIAIIFTRRKKLDDTLIYNILSLITHLKKNGLLNHEEVVRETAVIYTISGNLEKALEIVDNQIQDLHVRNDTLKEIAITLAKIGNLEKSLRVVKRIEPLFFWTQDRTLKYISIALTRIGDLEKALEIADSYIKTWWIRDEALKEIAVAYSYRNFEKAQEIANQIIDSFVKYEALEEINAIHIMFQELDATFNNARRINDLLSRADIFKQIATVLAINQEYLWMYLGIFLRESITFTFWNFLNILLSFISELEEIPIEIPNTILKELRFHGINVSP